MIDSPSFLGIIHRPMSKKTKTELQILLSQYDKTKQDATAHALVATLRTALDDSEKDRRELEKGIRTLELFLAEKSDCARKKP